MYVIYFEAMNSVAPELQGRTQRPQSSEIRSKICIKYHIPNAFRLAIIYDNNIFTVNKNVQLKSNKPQVATGDRCKI